MKFQSQDRSERVHVSQTLLRLRQAWDGDVRDLFERKRVVTGELFAMFDQGGFWKEEKRHALLVIDRLINVYGTEDEKNGPHTWFLRAKP